MTGRISELGGEKQKGAENSAPLNINQIRIQVSPLEFFLFFSLLQSAEKSAEEIPAEESQDQVKKCADDVHLIHLPVQTNLLIVLC
jgi:hypothetical protein